MIFFGKMKINDDFGKGFAVMEALHLIKASAIHHGHSLGLRS